MATYNEIVSRLELDLNSLSKDSRIPRRYILKTFKLIVNKLKSKYWYLSRRIHYIVFLRKSQRKQKVNVPF